MMEVMRTVYCMAIVLCMLSPGAGVTLAPPQVVFTDVPYNAWYLSALHEASASGIVSGYTDSYGRPIGLFGPGNPVTVGEALKISLQGAGYDTSAGVGYGHWAAKYMSVALGLDFQLTRVSSLNLDRPATRAEVASLIADAFKQLSGTFVGDLYTDVNAGTPYAGSIEELTKDGIFSGDTDAQGQATGTFRPHALIVRAEAVKMVMKARAEYGLPGGGSSASSSLSSTNGACKVPDCGPAPQMPNWQCPDGSLAGPSCERLPDGRCGWLIRQCGMTSSSSVSSKSFSSKSSLKSSSSSRSAQTYTVTYTTNGFQPSFIAVRSGDSVKFRNESEIGMWVASNPHPTHTDYPEFDQHQTKGKNGEYTLKFTRVGTWGFHNHENISHQAVITVDP